MRFFHCLTLTCSFFLITCVYISIDALQYNESKIFFSASDPLQSTIYSEDCLFLNIIMLKQEVSLDFQPK